MNKNLNLQDVFLNQARKEKISLTVFLVNGYQFKGIVKGFDSYIFLTATASRMWFTSTLYPRSHPSDLSIFLTPVISRTESRINNEHAYD